MAKTVIKKCPQHGETVYVVRRDGYARCRACNVEAVQKRRDKVKKMAVEYCGGACLDCGLRTEYYGVYDFHHRDPTQKDFAIGGNGNTRSWEKLKAEIDKCDMLCANCHRIRHAIEHLNGSSVRTRT